MVDGTIKRITLQMKLHGYHNSSATLSIIIALELKKLDYEVIAADIKTDEDMLAPTLEDKDKIMTQPLSIIEYLNEWYTHDGRTQKINFLPAYIPNQIKVRELALIIMCDIQSIDNTHVLTYLQNTFNITEDEKMKWYHHWIHEGFKKIEEHLSRDNKFCVGNKITLADIVLVPQVFNAKEHKCSLKQYPNIMKVYKNCLKMKEFKKAEKIFKKGF